MYTDLWVYKLLFSSSVIRLAWHPKYSPDATPISQIIYQQLPAVASSMGLWGGCGEISRRCRDHKSCNLKPSNRAPSYFFLLTCFHCLHLYFCSIFNATPPRTSRAFVLLLKPAPAAISIALHREREVFLFFGLAPAPATASRIWPPLKLLKVSIFSEKLLFQGGYQLLIECNANG